MLRRAVYAVIALALLAVILMTVTVGWRPLIGPRARELTSRTFEATEARLARGRYLVRSVSGCLACHSNVDTGRRVPEESAMTGEGKVMVPEGLPWLVAANLTPDAETGIGTWGDDVLARAIREGIGHDGRALFPMMPYPLYRQMSDEDLASVIVYLRSLPPVRNQLPPTVVPFPPGPLLNTIPEPLGEPVVSPDLRDPIRRGEYLASGIPYYTDELFVDTMRTGRVVARELNDIMPWWVYRHMTDDDLRAIFAYLRTLPPVSHRVDNTLEPTPCPVCGIAHGAGQDNTR